MVIAYSPGQRILYFNFTKNCIFELQVYSAISQLTLQYIFSIYNCDIDIVNIKNQIYNQTKNNSEFIDQTMG